MSRTSTIAKNTLALYVRMGVSMVISFWASRIVLDKLGIDDFGIYSVVGGVVVLFAFLNSALTGATQRFLNFELGRKNRERAAKVFSASLLIHLAIAGTVLVLAETVGIWFLDTKLNIPVERVAAAGWAYQFSVAGTLAGILRAPFNAAVIAYERMSFLAQLSIGECLAKFGILFLLDVGGADKLIFYAALMFVVIATAAGVNAVYCRLAFPQTTRFAFPRDGKLFRELLSFSAWNLISGVAILASTQGVNMVVNIFCGVAVNAAMGVASQVNSAVYQFVSNFQTAFSPQITKSYAENDRRYFLALIFGASKISCYMMLVLALPIWVNAEFALGLWLVDVPAHTVAFVRLTLIFALIDAVNGPLWMSIGATGDIRRYALCVSSLNLLNLPLAYVALRAGTPPESVLAIRIATNLLMMGSRLVILRRAVALPVRAFLKTVCVPACVVTAVAFPAPYFLARGIGNPWAGAVASSLAAIVVTAGGAWFFGFGREERRLVAEFAGNFLKKFRHS